MGRSEMRCLVRPLTRYAPRRCMSTSQPVLDPFSALWGMCNCAMAKLVYPQFDQAEFVEGAKQSFEQVNILMAAGEIDALKPMVSPTILRQVRSFHQDRAKSVADDTQLSSKTLKWDLDAFEHCQIMSIGLKIKSGQSSDDVSTNIRAAQQDLAQALQGESGGAKLSINVFFSASEKRTLLNSDGTEAEDPLVAIKNHLWTFERDFTFLNADARRVQPSFWEIADLK